MSRSIARAINALTRLVLSTQSPTRRTATLSRLIEELDKEGAYTVQTPYGPMKTLPLKGPHLAAAALGFHEEEPETVAWMDALQPGDVLYDIGAATGLFAMYAAMKEGVRVYAFEPKATSMGVLIEHLALNGLGERVFPLPLALSDRTEPVHLTLTALAPQTGGNSVGGAPDQFGLSGDGFRQGALAYRLDDLIAAFALPAPTHLKIDVDGIEGLILKGAPGALKGVKSVVVEVEGENAAEAATRLDPLLNAAGLVEDVGFRAQGSARNRLYRRL